MTNGAWCYCLGGLWQELEWVRDRQVLVTLDGWVLYQMGVDDGG